MADERKSRGIGCTVFLALILAAFVYVVYVGSNHRPTLADRCTDEAGAYVMAQEFVKRQLKAPATASFPWRTDADVKVTAIANCRLLVNGYVDAENSFGAKLRSPFIVELGPIGTGNEWQAYQVIIDQ
jgi:hypothetical protein